MFSNEKHTIRRSRIGGNLALKSGVSLVTVLMFMLVATIAATATYKWLTSEGRSSSSRMQKNEAYQSAVAGIESARSWMMYNANETGAIIKQYKDGKNAPVKLTDRLAAFVRAGQHYDVYLVGVNTESSTYKLKILSEGTSRNGEAKHSEIAVLNVNGLYQVKVPVEQAGTPIDFDYAYFGGSYDGAGSLELSSALVNGNWKGNPQGVRGKFVVTGDAELTGNNVTLGPLSCVGGDFLPENNGLRGGNLYVGGNVNGNMSLDSSAYFDGNVTNKNGGVFDIAGSVTLNGVMSPLPSLDFKIHKNFCTTEQGLVRSAAGVDADHKPFLVEGNVWMPGDFNLAFGKQTGSGCRCKKTVVVSYWPYKTKIDTVSCSYGDWGMIDCQGYEITNASSDNYDSYQKIKLGENAGSDVYIKTGHPWDDYNTMKINKTVSTLNTQIRNCKSNDCKGPADHDNWKTESLSPYIERAKKPDMYYIYNLPAGVADVSFGEYHDSFWNTNVYSFFINAPNGAKNEETRYTDSYNNFYRYMNYENGNIVGSPYCKKMDGKNFVPGCGVSPWFMTKGRFHNDLPEKQPFECAESVKNRCDSLWEKTDGCGGSSYLVKDPLVTAKDKFEPYASYGCASTITTYDASLVGKLNDCYKQLNKDENKRQDSLYNGFLVVKVSGGTTSTNPSGKLEGKFIVIATDALYTSFMDVEDTSYVFYFLEKGINTLNDATRKNTFIYTTDHIGSGNQFHLTGTIYATASSCADMEKLQGSSITYDPNLLEVLRGANIVCKNDGSVCGGTASSTSLSGEASEEYASGGYDNYYISVAPQLSVTLESQYNNTENVTTTNASDVEGSFIVLPRVIYLPKNAKGKLENYYNIIPLNTTSAVTSASVSCSGGLPTSGKLVVGDTKLSEGDYTCKVVGSVRSNGSLVQRTVPFWVRVKGEGGTLPVVSFTESTKEVNIGNSTPVSITMPSAPGGGSQSCNVKITVSGDVGEWSVTPTGDVESSGENTYSALVTSGSPLTVFNVTNTSSNDGSIYFTFTETDACTPGGPEVLYNANTAPIERKSIAQYCDAYPSDAECAVGGAYDNVKGRPDCGESGEWVSVNGTACSVSETNEKWNCAISGAISLKKVKNVAGCEVVIAPVSHTPPLTANKNPPYYLYASLKKIPMTFHAGFSVEGNISGDTKVKIKVEGENREKECSYSQFKDDSKNCDIMVYYGSVVTLSLDPANPSDFNYWVCESGLDCPDADAHASLSYTISITSDENIVYAHFGENDKHCFFDEFKEPTRGTGYRHNRGEIWCGNGTDYCIDYCENDGNTCASNLTTSSYSNAKWRLVSFSTASKDDIDYSVADARIALKSSATRGKKEAEKKAAVIMSSVQAGLYGTLKAQFQLPREGVSTGDAAKATIRHSGLMLRSNPTASSFLLLNTYIAPSGDVHARLCLEGGTETCKDRVLERNGSPFRPTDRNTVVLIAATIGTQDGHDALEVELYPTAWTSEPYSTIFALTNEELSGVTVTGSRPNEYVGYILSDQNFKLYGIGWKSDSYRSTCWDTPPTISCSFKAAYPTGIVPKGQSVKPWVGFSAWFDAVAGGCKESDIGYHYKGDDACNSTGSDYVNCGSSYTFGASGAHGYMEGENEMRMAKVDVATSCNVYGEEASWARNGVAANCGSFWVGDMNECTRHHSFDKTASGSEGDYFGLQSDGVANLRGANIKVNMDNPDGKSVEIYMFSRNNTSGYTYGNSHLYSLPYQTNKSGNGIVLDIPVDDLLNSEGFDSENVVGVYVKTFGEYSVNVNSVTSACPNAVEITGCNATYDNVNGKWNISATIKNRANAEKIQVTETHGYITNPSSLECEKETSDDSKKCVFSGDNAIFGWTDNPYVDHAGITYGFEITLTGIESTTSNCSTTGMVEGISATCGAVSGTGSVVQGKTLPQFTYSIANCPDNTCGYKIDLIKNSSVEKNIATNATSGNVTNAQTPSVAATKPNGDPLDIGTYKFALVSTNGDRPFVGCQSADFEVVAPGTISASCAFAGTVVKGGTATLQMTGIVNVEEETDITISRAGASAITDKLTSNGSKNISITAPDAADSYTYLVEYTDPVSGTTKKICDAPLTVVEGLGCSVSTSSITLGETFTFSPSYGGSCTSASLEGNGTISGSGCSAGSFSVTPSSVGDKTYTYKFSGDIGSNLQCTQTVTVNPPAPEFTCPANWGGVVGSNVSFNPGSSLKYCSSDYPCVLKIDGVTKSSSWTGPTYEWKDDDATTSTNKYTISLKNSYNDTPTEKDCSIKYTSDGVSATCSVTDNNGGAGLYEGQKIKLNVSDISGINNNVNMIWTFNGSDKTIDCGTGGCWNNEIDAPTSGTYSYSLSYNGNPVSGCSGNVTIAPALTCSVSPTTVNQGESYTFKGAANVNCWSCTYTWDNGSEGNHNPTDEITKTASAAGTKNLTLSCSCNNNLTGTCTTPITINGAAASSSSGGGDYVDVDLSGSVARDFNVGTSYKITKCGTDTKNLKCDANGGGKELYVNGSKVWTSFDWQNLTGNYQSAGDRCVVGNIITVKNGMIRCVNGW